MRRRSFLKGAVAGSAAVAATTVAAPAVAQERLRLKMVTSWPAKFPGLGTSALKFAEILRQVSDGRIEVDVIPGGKNVHALKCNDAVQQGLADLYHSADFYYAGKAPAYVFFSAVPFGLDAGSALAWLYHGGGQKLWDEVGAQFGVKHLLGGNTGHQMAGWFKKPIKTASDFKGLKMAIAGVGGDVLTALGGLPRTLAPADIEPALKAGEIDAAEWAGPWNDLALGLQQSAKVYHYPGFQEPGSMLSIGIAQKLWTRLTASEKGQFEAAAAAAAAWTAAQFEANNPVALETLIEKFDVTPVKLPDPVYARLGEAARDAIASVAAADPLAKKVHDSYMAFRKRAQAWSRFSEGAYVGNRALIKF